MRIAEWRVLGNDCEAIGGGRVKKIAGVGG